MRQKMSFTLYSTALFTGNCAMLLFSNIKTDIDFVNMDDAQRLSGLLTYETHIDYLVIRRKPEG